MRIVITHLDFSAYFVDRLLAFQEYCKACKDELYIIEVLGKSPLSCIFHTLGKKPLIDEWHTPAKAVFSFYDKSLQP